MPVPFRRGLAALVMILVAAACTATIPTDDEGQDTAPPCDGAVTTLAMNRCYGKAVEDSTAVLDALVARISDQLGAPELRDRRAAFLASQRAWSEFLQAHCGVVAAPYAGGSARPAVHGACMLALSQARVAQLDSLYAEWTRR